MKKNDVSNLIKALIPYVAGVIIGLVIALIICLSSGAFIETKEVQNYGFSSGEFVITNTTITGFSDAGNSVINSLSGILIGLGIITIIALIVDLFYLRREDGV